MQCHHISFLRLLFWLQLNQIRAGTEQLLLCDMPLCPLIYNAGQSEYTHECPGATQCFPLLTTSTELLCFLEQSSPRYGQGGRAQWGEEKRRDFSALSVLGDNECFVRENPSTVTAGRGGMSGKVMVCWLLTHVAQPCKVIEVQKMSCCCTSSICIAVSQDKQKYCCGDATEKQAQCLLSAKCGWKFDAAHNTPHCTAPFAKQNLLILVLLCF